MSDEVPKRLPKLTPQSIKLLNQLVRQIPPQSFVEALTKLYINHYDDTSLKPEGYEHLQRPLYMLIITLRKLKLK